MVWGIAKHFAAWIAYSAFGASPNNSAITNLALHTGLLRVCLPPLLFLVARLDRISQENRAPMSNVRFVRNLLSLSFAPSFDAGGWIKENLQGQENHNETRR